MSKVRTCRRRVGRGGDWCRECERLTRRLAGPRGWRRTGRFSARNAEARECTLTGGSEEIVGSNLTKHYKALRAVDNLSVSVRPGRGTGFLGPNGAGKTTTLRMLLGLVTPTAGTATFGGVRYVDLEQPIRHVGAVLEASSAHRGRTGLNHLRMICIAAGLPVGRADEALALVGLTP